MSVFLIFNLFLICAMGSTLEPQITGGTASRWGQFPAAVSDLLFWLVIFIGKSSLYLFQVRIETPFRQQNCMGTILDRHHILTAAHCVTTYSGQLENSFWFRVFAGDINIFPASSKREVRNVTRMFVSPGYLWNTRNHNLAVLRLNAPLPEFANSIEPAIRRTSFLLPNEQCQFVGWGAVSNVKTLYLTLLAFL
jgi:secreted trypsin-like serine protease